MKTGNRILGMVLIQDQVHDNMKVVKVGLED